ncbi:unnamed protein product, partial [Rotaria sp. Silwood1]
RNLKDLSTPFSANNFEWKSELEYLLLRAAYYNIPRMNLHGLTIYDTHHQYLLQKFRRDHCYLCKTVFGCNINSTDDLRRISRTIAFGIWQDNQLSIFDQTMCGCCRKKLEKQYYHKEIIEKSENIFSWLYDEYTIYTPSSASSSPYSIYEFNEDPDIQSHQRDSFREFLMVNGYQESVQMTNSYHKMIQKKQQDFRRKTKNILLFILQILASNDFLQVWKDIIESDFEETMQDCELDGKFGIVMNCIADAYNDVNHWSTRRQLLLIVAQDIPLYIIQQFIPDVTLWKLNAAKQQAVANGPGSIVKYDGSIKIRYTESQIAHFIQYILSPHITTDMPFGEKNIKLSSGDTIVVSNTIRNLLPTRIIQAYKEYCKECDEEFKPLSDTCLFEILHCCTASNRKSLQGLDYFACDGFNAFDMLTHLCDELTTHDVTTSQIVGLKKGLHESRNCLKNNYKLHVEFNSEVADHCIKYGLSDPRDLFWKEDCNHSHSMECDQCLLLKNMLIELRATIDSCSMTKEMKLRYLHRFDQNAQLIWDWKAHLMRCFQQDRARIDILQNLQNDSEFVLLDWAMKWLPMKYRETQRDFFSNLFN